jgi:signal transduction histidine kinase
VRWRLPILFALVAVITVATFGIVAYTTVRDTTADAAEVRLQSALGEIISITGLGVVNQREVLRAAAVDPALLDAVRAPGPPSEATLASLQRLKGVAPDSSVVVELLGRDGRSLLVYPEGARVEVGPGQALAPGVDAAIGPIYQRGSALYFQSAIALAGGGHDLGGVRITRRLRGGGGANRRVLANLLGPEAILLVGNRDGRLWNDSVAMQYPRDATELIAHRHSGTLWLSIAAPIRDTPWLYAVEMPERLLMAPARAVVTPFLIAGVLIALIGAAAGFQAGRTITGPLAELTAAAEAITRGERNVQLAATARRDEIGRLARAFGIMASTVRSVLERLEAESGARTAELTRAVERLRLLHEELRQNERFVTLGRLSGSVGHELRNPLGVMANVVFLLDTLPDASPRLREYAGLLREQVRLSERIISDLLDRARTGAPVRSTVDLAQLLDNQLAQAQVPAAIVIERRYAGMPPLVLDRDQVCQIVWNLIRNAVQAMQGGPGTLQLAAHHAAGRLRIEVRDTGPGVLEADRERIFEPTFTTKAEGVGLGLSVSRAFARANGGDLYVVPNAGPGACFVLELPVATAAETYGPAPAGPADSGRTPAWSTPGTPING